MEASLSRQLISWTTKKTIYPCRQSRTYRQQSLVSWVNGRHFRGSWSVGIYYVVNNLESSVFNSQLSALQHSTFPNRVLIRRMIDDIFKIRYSKNRRCLIMGRINGPQPHKIRNAKLLVGEKPRIPPSQQWSTTLATPLYQHQLIKPARLVHPLYKLKHDSKSAVSTASSRTQCSTPLKSATTPGYPSKPEIRDYRKTAKAKTNHTETPRCQQLRTRHSMPSPTNPASHRTNNSAKETNPIRSLTA